MKSLYQKHSVKLKLILYCFIISFVILLLTSKCSFFYPFNDWVDANAFFSMGKGLMHGLVPFRDLFEQKGPLLYLIYGLGYLMSHQSFLGIFFIEVIFWTISLYYTYKTINLFLNKKTSYLLLPVFLTFICTSNAFAHGGGAEELCMPFLSYALYVFLNHFKNQEITPKQLFFSGIGASCIFLIKYTLIGYFFAFMACLFFDLISKKETKKAFMSCLYFLSGMFIPLIITLIYFLANHALKDFIDVYFLVNLKAYNKETSNVFIKIFEIYRGFIWTTIKSGVLEIILLLLFPIFIIKLDLSKRGKVNLLIVYLFSIFTVYFGLRFYKYYLFPILIFGLISLISITKLLIFLKNKYASKLNFTLISILVLSSSLLYAYFFPNFKDMRFQKKEELFQYQFAQIINQEENPTLIEMGYVDCGVYTMANIVPHTYFFEELNLNHKSYPNNLDSFANYIHNKESLFIAYFTKYKPDTLPLKEVELYNNYDLIKYQKVKYDGSYLYAYLFKLKN